MAAELKKPEPLGSYYDDIDKEEVPYFSLGQLEQYAADRVRELQAQVEGLRADARTWEARYTELKKLVDRRPANNAGLFQTYPVWNGECYALDYFDAMDDSARAGREDGNG